MIESLMQKVLLTAALLVATFAASLSMQTAQAAGAMKGDPAAGETQVAVCGACHGPDGNALVPNFPKIAGLGERYLYEQLVKIRDGERVVAQMAGQLNGKSDQDLADIAAFYDSNARSIEQADPELLDLGEKIYRAGVAERNVAACIACHSAAGGGNDPAGFPALGGQYADYISAQLKAYRKGYEDPGGRRTDGDAMVMRMNAFGLSDKEIEAVSAYISGLN